MDKKTEAIMVLARLIRDIKDGNVVLIDMRMSRDVIEKETRDFYKEYEPAKEYRVELILANKK